MPLTDNINAGKIDFIREKKLNEIFIVLPFCLAQSIIKLRMNFSK